MTIKEFAEYRQRYNVPMTAIAKEMGVSRSYINNIEKQHENNPDVSDETMNRLLQALYAVVNKRNAGVKVEVKEVKEDTPKATPKTKFKKGK